jgi:hypothetical protein
MYIDTPNENNYERDAIYIASLGITEDGGSCYGYAVGLFSHASPFFKIKGD